MTDLFAAAPPAWHNRARTAQANPQVWAAPRTPQEVAAAVAHAAQAGLQVRPVGSGTALSPLAAGQEMMLSLAGLRGVAELSEADGTVTVWAGTPLGELAAALDSRGLSVPGLGGHAEQTVGGALATGTHATGLTSRRLGAAVTALELVDGQGQVRQLRPEDMHFSAAALSLGALGAVTRATLRTQPAYRLRLSTRSVGWGELMALGPEYAQAAPHVSLTWRPAREDHEAVLLRRAWPVAEASGAAAPSSGAGTGASLLGGPAQALADAGALFSPLPAPMRQLLESRAQAEVVLAPQHALLTGGDPLRELEYAVPLAALTPALRDLRAVLTRAGTQGTPLQLPVGVRFVAADDLLLGTPAGEGMAVITLGAPLALPPEVTAPHFRGAEGVLRAYGGLPAWGRLHGLGETELAALYPGWADFRAARDALDPQRRFGSPYLRRVLGE
ncbi:FAD-linked oxidoreductase [Deinococcus piscis]|uniref:FAD-linked oxidoreductase n=1 Tax=Deinococcus piscis TaxID=394230 RepID=A0ABQ3K0Z5_9DEIO|nr:FAD-binding protein [Deinococcus piscis]GHF99101.1 FAD-linked oxidoreductase [Deinococcus piscis]